MTRCTFCEEKLPTYKCIRCKDFYCEYHLKLKDHRCFAHTRSPQNPVIRDILDLTESITDAIVMGTAKKKEIRIINNRLDFIENILISDSNGLITEHEFELLLKASKLASGDK